MPNADPHDASQPVDKARLWRLLPYLFLGVAIGCVLVGVILNAKRQFLQPNVPSASATGTPAPSSPSGEQAANPAPADQPK